MSFLEMKMQPPVSRIGWNDQKMIETRIEVDKAKNIMKATVQKIMERNEKLNDLVDRAHRLEAASDEYVKCTVKINREFHWRRYFVQYIAVAVLGCCAIGGAALTFL